MKKTKIKKGKYRINMGDIFRIERDFGINLMSNKRLEPLNNILEEKRTFLDNEKLFLDIIAKKEAQGKEANSKEIAKMKSILYKVESYDRRYEIEKKFLLSEVYFAYLNIRDEETKRIILDVMTVNDLEEFQKSLESAFNYHFKPQKVGNSERDKNIIINGEKKPPPDRTILWYITYAINELGMSYDDVINIQPSILVDMIQQSGYLYPRKESYAIGK